MIGDAIGTWKELSALYEEADALDANGRNALLRRLESEASPLLGPLRRMLDARSRVAEDDFLGQPPSLPEAGSTEVSQWRAGAAVGPYRLLRHLGSGGMAEVWLAERADGSFERTVAIKLLFDHPSHAQRQSFAERFRRERDILAALDHPRIARLHDAGVTASGQPWLALEAVDGEPITVWCDRERLALPARVRLFREVLDAVEHAHVRLVIHRDIKPSNVLVGKDGTVRLLDFGISKLVEVPGQAQAETALTRHGGRPFTPEYASPEQLQGEPLTTACDIYSLGVLLHELLVGSRPSIRRDPSSGDIDVELPSRCPVSLQSLTARDTDSNRLARGLRPDIDAIVLKTLDSKPTRRYESVGALRADLDRWLADEPVLATVPGRFYRLSKFARRHRFAVTAGGLVAIVLALALALALWQGARAREESARALVAKDFLLKMFRLSDPNESGTIAAGAMLDAGVERANVTLRAQPLLHAEVLGGIAEIEQHLGRYAQADAILRQAEDIYAGLDERRALALLRVELADNAFRLGQIDKAGERLATVADDRARFTEDHGLQARAEEVEGWLALQRRDVSGAERHMRMQLDHAVAAFGAHDARTADAWRGLAAVASELAHYDLAMKDIAAAQEAIDGASNANAADRVGIEVESANFTFLAGWYSQARDRIVAARRRCDAILGDRNEECVFLRRVDASSLIQMGRADEALLLLPAFEAEAQNNQAPARQPDAVVMAARILCASAHLGERADIMAGLIRIAHSPVTDAERAAELPARLVLAEAALRSNRVADARQELVAAFATDSARNSTAWRARALVLEGIALQMQERHEEAVGRIEKAAALLAITSGASHPNVAIAKLYEVPSLLALGQRARATELAEKAIELLRARLPADAPLLARVSAINAELRAPAGSPLRAARHAVFFEERSP